MFALLISDHFPVGDEDWFFEVCEGDGADAVKFACVAEDVSVARSGTKSPAKAAD